MRISARLKASLGLILIVISFSCKKDLSKSRSDLLVAKTWVYNEYIENYSTSNATLAFRLGKINNLINLSLSQIKFQSNGTFTETIGDGSQHSGTWNYVNNDTELIIHGFDYSSTYNVINLTASSFIWYDSTADNFAEMIAK